MEKQKFNYMNQPEVTKKFHDDYLPNLGILIDQIKFENKMVSILESKWRGRKKGFLCKYVMKEDCSRYAFIFHNPVKSTKPMNTILFS
jgi:hypothetical protein